MEPTLERGITGKTHVVVTGAAGVRPRLHATTSKRVVVASDGLAIEKSHRRAQSVTL